MLGAMNEKTEFAERLIAALVSKGIEPRPSVVERHFNERYWGTPITFQAVRRWLRGESIPEQDKLLVLADWLDVEPQVLRYGAPATKVREKKPQWGSGLEPSERELLEMVMALPAPQKKIVREVVLAFTKAYAKKA